MTDHYQMCVQIDVNEQPRWRDVVPGLLETFIVDLKSRGLQPDRPLPIDGLSHEVQAEIRGPFRVLCAYQPFPIIGVEDEPDEEGEPVYVYGPPCYVVRADCFVKPHQ